MAAIVVCTNCGAKLTLKGAVAPGKKVNCPKCMKPFVVEDEEEPEEQEVEDESDHEEEGEPASKKKVKAATKDDDENEDETDEDEKPAKKKKETEPKKKSNVLLIVGIIGGVLFCCCGAPSIASLFMQTTIKGWLEGKQIAKDGGIDKRIDDKIKIDDIVKPTDAGKDKDVIKPKDDAKDKDAKLKDKDSKDKDKNKEKEFPKGQAADVAKAIAGAKAMEQGVLEQMRARGSKVLPKGTVGLLSAPIISLDFLAFSPTAPVVVGIGRKKDPWYVVRWDLTSGKITHESKTPEDFRKRTSGLVFSPNGELVATLIEGPNRLRVYKAADLTEAKTFNLDSMVASQIAFSDDGSRLTVTLSGFDRKKEIKAWNTADWQELKVNIKPERGQEFAFGTSGNTILAMYPSRIDHLDLDTGAKFAVDHYKMDNKVHLPGTRVTLSPSGRTLSYLVNVATGNTEIRLLDLDNVTTTTLVAEKFSIFGASFTRDGRFIYYYMPDGKMGKTKFVDLATKQAHSVPLSGWGSPGASAFSAGGVFLAVPSQGYVFLYAVDDISGGKK